MSFKWELYIRLADELISCQEKVDLREAYLRSAMSRSYYGIFAVDLSKRTLEKLQQIAAV